MNIPAQLEPLFAKLAEFGLSQGAVVGLLLGGALLVVVLALSESFKPSHKGPALDKREWRKFKLLKKEKLTHNTRRFTFSLQTPTTELGLPCGKHLKIRLPNETGELVAKPYTPTTLNECLGYFELVVKIYDDGALTPLLDRLVPGRDHVEACGPHGLVEYVSPEMRDFTQAAAKFSPATVKYMSRHRPYARVGMIAGGTGITPMFQVLAQIDADNRDKTPASLIFGNVSEDDILLRDELEEVCSTSSQVSVHLVVDRVAEGSAWKGGVGYVTAEMIRERLPAPAEDTAIFLCGPPVMVEICKKTLVEKVGHDPVNVFSF